MNALGNFIRRRARELDMTLAEVARESGRGRQTIYSISEVGARLPDLETIADIALALEVHPLQLVQMIFEDRPLPMRQTRAYRERGDQSIFRADVTIPDGTVMMAGSTFTKVWELQNLGTVPWERRSLVCMDDDIEVRAGKSGMSMRITEKLIPSSSRIPVPCTPPGGVVRLAVEFRAPAIPCTCVSYWKSAFEDGTLCLPNSVGLTCVVRVISMQSTQTSELRVVP